MVIHGSSKNWQEQQKGNLKQLLYSTRARPLVSIYRNHHENTTASKSQTSPASNLSLPKIKSDPLSCAAAMEVRPPEARCPLYLIHSRHFGSLVQQQLHHFNISHLGGLNQWCLTILGAQTRKLARLTALLLNVSVT